MDTHVYYSSYRIAARQMLTLYRLGYFVYAPLYLGCFEWNCPTQRTIIPLHQYNIPKTVRQLMRRSVFEVRHDTQLWKVVRGCGARTAQRPTSWITPPLIAAYERLQKQYNCMHTVEVYQNGVLVGGLYGVVQQGAFFGESMFSRVSQASKVAFAHLIEHLAQQGFVLLDVQMPTAHLAMFGAQQMAYPQFDELLQQAYQQTEVRF